MVHVMEPLRIGVLGAARISGVAIVEPARLTGHRLVAVAARDRSRAEQFAAESDIERVLDSYQAVIDDPEVEAIYNPLPNGLHGPWNLRAIAAGKHVLSEKPSASNAAEAREVRDAAKASGVKFMEAFHYRYHPVMNRMLEIAGSGELGQLQHVDVHMSFPNTDPTDPRWDFVLAGGATMDVGCYAIHGLRTLGAVGGGEPSVVSASAVERAGSGGVDEMLEADLVYPSGLTAHFESSFVVPEMDFTMRITGSDGEAFAHNFCVAALDDRITVNVGGRDRVEELGKKTTYTYQLEAFADHVRNDAPIHTDADDAVTQAEFIDACYTAAGFPLRPVSTI
jgi:predicted dehydrogenase